MIAESLDGESLCTEYGISVAHFLQWFEETALTEGHSFTAAQLVKDYLYLKLGAFTLGNYPEVHQRIFSYLVYRVPHVLGRLTQSGQLEKVSKKSYRVAREVKKHD